MTLSDLTQLIKFIRDVCFYNLTILLDNFDLIKISQFFWIFTESKNLNK